MLSPLHGHFLRWIYADHNDSAPVRTVVQRVLAEMPTAGIGLNVGGGATVLGPRILTLELEPGPGVGLVGTVQAIPLADASLDLVLTQEVLEHVADPFAAIAEIARVLKPGGRAYVQLPFMLGYHPCPHDFWRFSDEGIVRLVEGAGLAVEESGPSVGPAVGFYRVAVEFLAILFSLPLARLYRPAKAGFALLLFPLKWLDPLMRRSPQRARVAGGFYALCRKRG